MPTEAKFTPGPWEFGSDHLSDALIVFVRHTATNQLHLKLVVATIWESAGPNENEFNARDNAALIASAPDLYEACRQAAQKFRQYEALHEAKGTVEGAQKAGANAAMAKLCEAALAKAEGR